MLSQVREVVHLTDQPTDKHIKICLVPWKLKATTGILSLIVLGVSKQCSPVRPRTRGLVKHC